MPVFPGFLVLSTFVLPVIALSQPGQFVVSLAFGLTPVSGAFATIRHRTAVWIIVLVTVSTLAADLVVEIRGPRGVASLDSALRVAILSIMFCVTLKRTLRPGRIDGYRVIGGIAAYLLIGLTWTLAYQLLLQLNTSAIRFGPDVAEGPPGHPSHLICFSFTTLATVGFGDVHPATSVAQALTVTEALAGQLYVAILTGSLVGMALQARPAERSAAAGD